MCDFARSARVVLAAAFGGNPPPARERGVEHIVPVEDPLSEAGWD